MTELPYQPDQMAPLKKLVLSLSAVVSVIAHGIVSGIVINGKYYSGYDPAFQFQTPPPTVIGWSVPLDLDRGFINPGNYTNSDIICHKSATPGGTHAIVAAGGEVELQWTAWPDSHHGPVLDYLAKCDGVCEKADKMSLKFFKIYEAGLNEWVTQPGNWATDDLIHNNNSHTVKIPANIAPGNYVLRHEIIALHSANNPDGAQNYPQCINLKITGSGTESPAGVLATELYKATDPGILVNIYWPALTTYIIPGPSVYNAREAAPTTTALSWSRASTSSILGGPATSTSTQPPAVSGPTTFAPSPTFSDGADSTRTTTRTTLVKLTSTTTGVPSAAVVYTTAYETATETISVTVTGTDSAAYISPTTPSPSSPQAFTSEGPVAHPTTMSANGNDAPNLPLNPFPDGLTFGGLLQWLDYVLATRCSVDGRVHAKDFVKD